jgi:hypothetical protein
MMRIVTRSCAWRLSRRETALERRYALRAVKQRLHQASFREAVITAYNGRCALSGLPEPLLLDAAHIVADKDEQFGHRWFRTASRSQSLGNAARPQKDWCWLGTTTAIDPCRVAGHTGNVQDASLD